MLASHQLAPWVVPTLITALKVLTASKLALVTEAQRCDMNVKPHVT